MHEPVGEPSVDISESEVARRERSTEQRAADHDAIERLGEDLLPALIAKLGATGLGELEVREGDWRVRLRRPAPAEGAQGATARERRPADRDRSSRGVHASSGSHLAPVGPGREARDGSASRDGRDAATRDGTSSRDGRDGSNRDAARIVAISPAVGVFQPRAEAGAGTRSGRATASAPWTCWGSRNRSWPLRTAWSAPTSSIPATQSSTARNSSSSSSPPPPRSPERVPQGPDRQPRRDRAADPACLPRTRRRGGRCLQRGRSRFARRPARRRGDLHRSCRMPSARTSRRRP